MNGPYEKYCERKKRNIESHLNSPQLSEGQRKQLREFLADYNEARKLSIPSQESYVRSLSFFGQFLHARKKEFKAAKKADLQEYLKSLDGKSRSISDWARMALKVFYRWLISGKVKKKEPFPALVSWITVSFSPPSKIKKEDCISLEEYEKMLSACSNQRDRAFLSVLIDSGGRVGEILNARIGNVKLDTEPPSIFFPTSKTEPHPVGLLLSFHELKRWIAQHPLRNQPDFKDAYLFCVLKEHNGTKRQAKLGQSWDYGGAYRAVKDIAKRAGITKPIRIHLWRHSAASIDRSNGMADQLMNLKYGWSERSRMASRYAHVDWKDVYAFQRRAQGFEQPEQDKEFKACWRCGERNLAAAQNCQRCAALMNEQEVRNAPSMMEQFQKAVVLMNEAHEKRFAELEARLKKSKR